MGFWDELTQGMANAADDMRHEWERAAYDRETTGGLELPRAEAEPTKWDSLMAAQDAPQMNIEPPEPQQDMGMER